MRTKRECRIFSGRLPEYLYGEASPAVRRAVVRHAESCADCAPVLREMEKTVATLRGHHPVELTPAEVKALRVRVMERVRVPEPFAGREERFWPVFSYRLVPLAAAAVIILVVTVLIAVWRPGVERREPVTESGLVAALSETIEREFQVMGELWRELDELEIILDAGGENELEASVPVKYQPV